MDDNRILDNLGSLVVVIDVFQIIIPTKCVKEKYS